MFNQANFAQQDQYGNNQVDGPAISECGQLKRQSSDDDEEGNSINGITNKMYGSHLVVGKKSG